MRSSSAAARNICKSSWFTFTSPWYMKFRIATMSGKRILIWRKCGRGEIWNWPSEEDHGLWVRVFLEHDAEEGGAGGEDQLVSSHHVPVTHLQWKRQCFSRGLFYDNTLMPLFLRRRPARHCCVITWVNGSLYRIHHSAVLQVCIPLLIGWEFSAVANKVRWMLLLLNHAPSVICDQVLLQPAYCLSHCQCYKLKWR